MCGEQIEACVSAEGLTPRRCQRRVLRRCRSKGVSVCAPSTTTTTFTPTTTTLLDLVFNPWTGILPAPDVRGTWDVGFYGTDDNYTDDGCGYLEDPEAAVAGSLVIAGDSYHVDETTLKISGISGILGPLTNLVSPTTTFSLDMARLSGGDDFPAKDTRGSVILAGNTCDPDTNCCLRIELDLYYGCSEMYCPPERIRLDIDDAPGFLQIRRDCSTSMGDAGAPCSTVLFGNVLRQPR